MDEPSTVAREALVALVRGLLPDAWRHAVAVAPHPTGFAVHFSDAEGRRHALHARRSRSNDPTVGDSLAYSYTRVGAAIDVDLVRDAYRVALEQLAAQSEEVLTLLDQTYAPDEAPSAEAGAVSDEAAAPDELLTILREALPEAWRHEVTAALSPDGFLLRFVDAGGRRHALEGRSAGAAEARLVPGDALAFSYVLVDAAVDEPALADDYRVALTALAAREAEILPWLSLAERGPVSAPSPSLWAGPFPDERPTPPELTTILHEVLPEHWRSEVTTSLTRGGVLVRFTDDRGGRHTFVIRRNNPRVAALVSGHSLSFSYLFVDKALDEVTLAAEYRDALNALAAREDDLLPWVPQVTIDPLDPSFPSGIPVPPPESPAPPELTALLREAMPERWRHGLVVSRTPGGFLVRFRDERGDQHAFDARQIQAEEPTLVGGQALAYSYLPIDREAEETTLAAEYRPALAALAAREADFLPWLSLGERAPLPEPSPPSWAGPFPDESAAPPELAAIIRDAMPEPWRHEVVTSLTRGGVLVRFADDQGGRHTFDIREADPEAPALVSGRVLSFSYLFVDKTLTEAALVDAYRDALNALAAREDDLLPWVPRAASASLDTSISSGIPAPPPESPAPPELTALLREAMPERWRRDLVVSRTPGGFLVRFRDERGDQHAFDARQIQAEEPTLVGGRALAYSYLPIDREAEETTLAAEYRPALAALAAREADFLPWLSLGERAPLPEPSPPTWAGPFPNESEAPPELAAIVRDAMPEPWRRAVATSLIPDGLLVRFTDDRDGRHTFDIRRASPEAPALVSGRVLSFSYLFVDETLDEAALADDYRAALNALAAREDDLLPWVPQAASGSDPDASAPASKTQPPPESPAPPELTALLHEAMPERWRRDLVASRTPGGFLVRFRDERGDQHAFDARQIRVGEPTMVSGKTLAYSYLPIDREVEETILAAEYRPALVALARREADFLPWVVTAPVVSPVRPELVAAVREALPERWRHDIQLSLTPTMLVVHLRDADGRERSFGASEIQPGVNAPVRGRIMALSILPVAGHTEDLTAEYREVLEAFVAREAEIRHWAAASSASAYAEAPPLPDRPTPPALESVVREALPAHWRHEVVVSLTREGFIAWCRDDAGERHAFEARENAPGVQGLVSGRALAFSYLIINDRVDEFMNEYRAVLVGIAAREAEILPLLAR